MTRILRSICWAVFAFLPAGLAAAAPAGQISEYSGFVTVGAPQQSPVSARKGSGVDPGQVITTGTNGRAVIKFQDGQTIALKSNSIFKVNSYKFDQASPEKGESVFALLEGGLRAITGLIGSSNKAGWRLATPTATAGIRGTDFFVVIGHSRDRVKRRYAGAPGPVAGGPVHRTRSHEIQEGTFYKVNSGAITATNAGGTTIVAAGYSRPVTALPGLTNTAPIPPALP